MTTNETLPGLKLYYNQSQSSQDPKRVIANFVPLPLTFSSDEPLGTLDHKQCPSYLFM